MPPLDYTIFAQTPKRTHFVGISGIGMGALAKLCLDRGWHVRGSTLAHNSMTQQLMELGATIFDRHSEENLDSSTDCVVYSSAITEQNPEIQMARSKNIPVIHRSDLLRAFVAPLPTIAISGTHGKTTTTSLLGHVLYRADRDPLIISGGMMGAWKSPIYPGKGPFAIVEADESDHSHINFPSLSGAILTNVGAEHMDHYGGSLAKLWESYEEFIGLAKDFAIVCQDSVDPNHPAMQNASCPITWYGTSSDVDFQALNIAPTATGMKFDCQTPFGLWRDIPLSAWGHHNVLNATAVIAASTFCGLSKNEIIHGLSTFLGVDRRLTHVGNLGNTPIMDDYAHHPTEIAAVLSALQERGYRRILAICEPHRYTRLRNTMPLFCTCFHHATDIVLLPVYSAGEKPIAGFDSIALGQKLQDLGHSVTLAQAWPDCSTQLHSQIEAQHYDIAICLGAGYATHVARSLVDA